MAVAAQIGSCLNPAHRAQRMSGTRVTALLATVLTGTLAAATANPEPPDEASPIDFSVLTPALEGRYYVASQIDLTVLIPPYLALGSFGRGRRSEQLRALVAREGYRPERTIADRLIDRLGEASFRAVHEPVQRKPAGSVQTLSWSDLPERPRGQLTLDVTIRWLCLCSDVAFTKFYPAIALNWRLLDPARQSVVLPTRTLVYHHFPAWYRKEPAPEYPVEVVSERCGFDSVMDAAENPDVLWGCFGDTYDAALRRLVIDLKKART